MVRVFVHFSRALLSPLYLCSFSPLYVFILPVICVFILRPVLSCPALCRLAMGVKPWAEYSFLTPSSLKDSFVYLEVLAHAERGMLILPGLGQIVINQLMSL